MQILAQGSRQDNIKKKIILKIFKNLNLVLILSESL